jgi:hypothetical protein
MRSCISPIAAHRATGRERFPLPLQFFDPTGSDRPPAVIRVPFSDHAAVVFRPRYWRALLRPRRRLTKGETTNDNQRPEHYPESRYCI